MNHYPSYHFSFFRIYMGCYLLFSFLSFLPSSSDLWSNEGILPEARLNFTYGVFPNILNLYDDPLHIKIFLLILSALAIFFTIGFQRRWAALLLWYGWTCLLNRNNLTLNPSLNYVGWLLLACAIIPSGEPFSLSKRNNKWEMPKLIFTGAWIILAAGYFISGIDKLNSPSWVQGTALQKIMDCPLGKSWSSEFLHSLPSFSSKLINWLVIAGEIICLPLSFFAKTRKWAWVIITLIQAGILLFMNIAPIVYGMLTIHLFTFDPRWFKLKTLSLKPALTLPKMILSVFFFLSGIP